MGLQESGWEMGLQEKWMEKFENGKFPISIHWNFCF